MANLDLKGLFLGGLLALIGFLVIASAFALATSAFFPPHAGPYLINELISLIFVCLACYVWGGYIVSRISAKGKILNPLIFGALAMIMAIFPAAEVPLWYVAITAIMAIPATYVGAIVHCRKANPSFKRDALKRAP